MHSCRSNATLFSIDISCQAGYSGGENQHFILRQTTGLDHHVTIIVNTWKGQGLFLGLAVNARKSATEMGRSDLALI